MLPRRMVVIGLFYCCIKTCVTQTKVLFPAANRIKRGATNVDNPNFHTSFNDVHLLFEILLTGAQFESSGEFSMRDAELASLRRARNLKVICEEIIPRKLTEIVRLNSELSNQISPLHQDDFERTLLTLVYTAQQMVESTNEHQKHLWTESFINLYKAIEQDLTRTN
ncbi:protein FAM180A-like [Antennarius striatus]|uniref:protein FAM180A-like n=1 Tax=Antennarius striatus TaxID=241820 RepID=UPI0035AD8431